MSRAPAQNDRPRIAVCYDLGAVGPVEIAASLRDCYQVVFVVRDSAHTRELMRLLTSLGHVVMLEDAHTTLEQLDVAGVVTYCDGLVQETAALALSLGLGGLDDESARRVTDKHLQRRALPASISTRSFSLVSGADWTTAAERLGGRAVIKPRHGAGSRDTYLVESLPRGHRVLAPYTAEDGTLTPQFVAEEILAGHHTPGRADYVSVESVVQRGAVTHIQVTGKFPLLPPFREPGQFWPSGLPTDLVRQIEATVSEALDAVGFHTGVAHTELKLTDEGPRIIEVNGRLGGFIDELAGRSAGLSLVRIAADVAAGRRYDHQHLQINGVHFQYSSLAPVQGCRLVKVRGAEQLRRLPGIRAYRPLRPPGTSLAWDVGTNELDLVLGDAASHDEMKAIVDEALQCLTYSFEISGEIVDLDGQELAELNAVPPVIAE